MKRKEARALYKSLTGKELFPEDSVKAIKDSLEIESKGVGIRNTESLIAAREAGKPVPILEAARGRFVAGKASEVDSVLLSLKKTPSQIAASRAPQSSAAERMILQLPKELQPKARKIALHLEPGARAEPDERGFQLSLIKFLGSEAKDLLEKSTQELVLDYDTGEKELIVTDSTNWKKGLKYRKQYQDMLDKLMLPSSAMPDSLRSKPKWEY